MFNIQPVKAGCSVMDYPESVTSLYVWHSEAVANILHEATDWIAAAAAAVVAQSGGGAPTWTLRALQQLLQWEHGVHSFTVEQHEAWKHATALFVV